MNRLHYIAIPNYNECTTAYAIFDSATHHSVAFAFCRAEGFEAWVAGEIRDRVEGMCLSEVLINLGIVGFVDEYDHDDAAPREQEAADVAF